jgi:hypothetical protein
MQKNEHGWRVGRSLRSSRAHTWMELRKWGLATLPTSVMYPGTAATISSALYLSKPRWAGEWNQDGPHAFITGTVLGVVVWLLGSALFRRFAMPETSNTAAYGELASEYHRLKPRLDCLPADCAGSPSHCEARAQLDQVAGELGLDERTAQPAYRWILATGYTAAWSRIHRADECMFDLECESAVVGFALYDELRLLGARIPEKDEMLSKLRTALVALDPSAGKYLHQPPSPHPEHPRPVFRLRAVPRPGAHRNEPVVHIAVRGRVLIGRGLSDADRQRTARVVLRQIRHSINEFRDDRREGLIRARNNLFATVLFTGLTAYLVLGLALIEGVSRPAVLAAFGFYLVGAVVGLFRHLRNASARDTIVEEDYGLSYARMIQLPLFSGVAAVAGVVLTALLPALVPTTSASDRITAPALSTIFNLTTNPSYLVVAAIFGLTPNLLISRLQQQAESYKADLKSSEAAEHVR